MNKLSKTIEYIFYLFIFSPAHQKALAKKIHTSQAAVARIERGDYLGYSLRTLEKVALATGTRLDIQFSL